MTPVLVIFLQTVNITALDGHLMVGTDLVGPRAHFRAVLPIHSMTFEGVFNGEF